MQERYRFYAISGNMQLMLNFPISQRFLGQAYVRRVILHKENDKLVIYLVSPHAEAA